MQTFMHAVTILRRKITYVDVERHETGNNVMAMKHVLGVTVRFGRGVKLRFIFAAQKSTLRPRDSQPNMA